MTTELTPAELARIQEWDKKAPQNDLICFGVTVDRRMLLRFLEQKLFPAAGRIAQDHFEYGDCDVEPCEFCKLLRPFLRSAQARDTL